MRSYMQRFKRVVAEYGVIALVIHYAIFALVIAGAYLALRGGWEPTGRIAGLGTWAAAYVVAKLTQPVRIVATIVLAPIAARLYARLSGRDRGVRGSCPVMEAIPALPSLADVRAAADGLPSVSAPSVSPAAARVPESGPR